MTTSPVSPASTPSLLAQVQALAPRFASAAQAVYDGWQPDADGFDGEFGGGGICDAVADALADVLGATLPDAESTLGGQDGDDHAWLVVWRGDEAVSLDIPADVYESGAGYAWVKRAGVTISAADVAIAPFERKLVDELLDTF